MRRICPAPTIVDLNEVYFKLDLLIAAERIEDGLPFRASFGRNMRGGFSVLSERDNTTE
jgi:hypothetical protein